MARKIEHIYHQFAFAELTCLDEFFKRIGESKDGKKKQPLRLLKI